MKTETRFAWINQRSLAVSQAGFPATIALGIAKPLLSPFPSMTPLMGAIACMMGQLRRSFGGKTIGIMPFDTLILVAAAFALGAS
jgi:hypothetical protein